MTPKEERETRSREVVVRIARRPAYCAWITVHSLANKCVSRLFAGTTYSASRFPAREADLGPGFPGGKLESSFHEKAGMSQVDFVFLVLPSRHASSRSASAAILPSALRNGVPGNDRYGRVGDHPDGIASSSQNAVWGQLPCCGRSTWNGHPVGGRAG